MKQKTYCANTMEELSAALSDIKASSEYREASDVLVHVLSDLFPVLHISHECRAIVLQFFVIVTWKEVMERFLRRFLNLS